MSIRKIVLDEKDFSALVSGKEVIKGETHIILSDIGFRRMERHVIEAKLGGKLVLNDDSDD